MAWLDIIIIALVIIIAIVGLARGFLKSLLQLFGTLITLVVSILLARPFAALLENWFGMSTALGNALVDPITPYCVESGTGGISNFFLNKFAEILMGQNYWQNPAYPQGAQDPAFIADFAGSIGDVLAVVISVVILYFLFRIAVAILGKIVDKITQNRAIGGLDRLFGFILGLLKGCLVVSVVFVLAYLFSPVIPAFGEWLNNLLAENPVSNTVFGWLATFTDNTLIPWFNSIT